MTRPSWRSRWLWPYVASFAAGCGAALIFWALQTPTPVPPLVGLVGLLGIAVGEGIAARLLAALTRRRGTR